MAARYDLRNVVGAWGVVPLTGMVKDSALTITFNQDFNSVQVSGDGVSNTRSVMNDRSARIQIQFMQTALANALMNTQFAAQEAGAPSPSFEVTSLDTGESFIAESAWIAKPPDSEYGEESGTRTWVLETDRLIPKYGDAAIIELNQA